MGMALFPAKAPADEQALLAHRYVTAGHYVARQSADVAAVAQNHPGIAQPEGTERQKGQGAAEAQQRA
ncbi:hypothetical protein D3C84_1251470 [compost metagenome]